MRPSFKFDPASKFRSKKVVLDGITFDSKKESQTYLELKGLLERGEIQGFEMQHTFELVPAQCETVSFTNKKGTPKTKQRVVERAVTYTADFVVKFLDGEVSVIDCKGSRGLDQKYPIKRKLMRWRHGIVIKEV